MPERASDNDAVDDAGDGEEERAGTHAIGAVSLYAAARLLLAVVLTGVIYVIARLVGITQFPIVVAALFALIIAMPLGIWVFSPLRRRATAALAIAGERRRREREQLQARLHGDVLPDGEREET